MRSYLVLLPFFPSILALPTVPSTCSVLASLPNSCSSKPITIQSQYQNPTYTTFPCPFTLSVIYQKQTAPFIVYYFYPNNPRAPYPAVFFGNSQPAVQFKLQNGLIDANILAVPASADDTKYHQYLVHTRDDPYGTQQVLLADEVVPVMGDKVEGRLAYKCIDGVERLILMPPNGSMLIAFDSEV